MWWGYSICLGMSRQNQEGFLSLTSLWPSKIDLKGRVAHACHRHPLPCCRRTWVLCMRRHFAVSLSAVHDIALFASVHSHVMRLLFNLCRQHFQLKKGVVQQQMQEWLAKADKITNTSVKEAVTAIKAELERL
jgi:hypothetical protein